MAKCDICNKEIAFGIKVSHSHRRSNRTWAFRHLVHQRRHLLWRWTSPATPVCI